jgi:hypothetical protein
MISQAWGPIASVIYYKLSTVHMTLINQYNLPQINLGVCTGEVSVLERCLH